MIRIDLLLRNIINQNVIETYVQHMVKKSKSFLQCGTEIHKKYFRLENLKLQTNKIPEWTLYLKSTTLNSTKLLFSSKCRFQKRFQHALKK